MKILIMVLSHNDNGIYNRLVETIKETWDSEVVDDIETIYYYNDSSLDSIKINGDELFIPCEDGIDKLGYKVLSTFEYILDNFDFDYIFKMNCSSYLNKGLLKELVKNMPTNNLYAGYIGIHDNITFASGAGSLLSKDLVKLILDNKDKWRHSLIEDVAIGEILMNNNIGIIPMNRVSIINGIDNHKLNTECHHYRCKNDNREMDIIIMKELYKIYKK